MLFHSVFTNSYSCIPISKKKASFIQPRTTCNIWAVFRHLKGHLGLKTVCMRQSNTSGKDVHKNLVF